MNTTRRNLLIAAAATAISGAWGQARSEAGTPVVRYNATTPEGKEMLRIYAQGVKAMRALSAADPQSWTFQWYIHATPKSKSQLLNDVFGTSGGPGRDLANETWYTCQSHLGQPEDYFLPWHRLYVAQFEEIIRTVTGHPEFTLPYWDYTSPSSYSMPEEFQDKNKNDPAFSTLFVANRNRDGGPLRSANVNAGEPLNKHFPGVRNFLVLPDMTKGDYGAFCSQLDSALHGNVHVYAGDSSNMGNVPTAAGDPIFWLHHCNIDRIWTGWNALGHKNPAETNGKSWADTRFVFASSDGRRVELSIDKISDSTNLPYRYDTLPGQVVVAQSSRAEDRLFLRSVRPGSAPGSARAGVAAGPVVLGAAPQTIKLEPTDPQNRLRDIAPRLSRGDVSRLVLVLNSVQAHVDPHTTYEVFLDLPANTSGAAADDHYVGLLNFFGATGDQGHGAHVGKSVEFDVSDVVQRLRSRGGLQEETSVTLVPVGEPAADAEPSIAGGVELRGR